MCLNFYHKWRSQTWKIAYVKGEGIFECYYFEQNGLGVVFLWAWAQFCCKMWGDSLVWNQYSHRVDAEVAFYIYRFPFLFLEMFWEQHLSRFILSLQIILHINTLEFVAGHATVVQSASINIVFGCKQAQKYSRTHHLGFIKAVSWSA